MIICTNLPILANYGEKTGLALVFFIFIVLLFNICSIQYFVIYTRILDLSIILMNLYLLQVLDMIKRKHKIIIIIGLVLFSLALGSVNLNLIQANDFNNIFSNMNENIFYFFRN